MLNLFQHLTKIIFIDSEKKTRHSELDSESVFLFPRIEKFGILKSMDLLKKLDELEAGNLSDLEKANKELESAQNEIAELKRNNAIRDQREKVMETMKVTSEQAKQIVKDDGSIDYDVLGQITSDKESAAAEAKEKEIADNSMNPGGGSADGSGKEKSEAEKVAETIGKDLAGINETAKATVESYM